MTVKYSTFVFLVLTLTGSSLVGAQDPAAWPQRSSCISPYMGFAGVVLPVSLQYEQLWHLEKIHTGFATGPVATYYFDESEIFLGGYLAAVLMTGMNNHHFEARLGASYHPLELTSRTEFGDTDFPFIPVVTVGYRYQLPGHNQYFRASFGSGGIGIGMGIMLGQTAYEQKGGDQ